MKLHPRLSLSALVTPTFSFAEDLAFWSECGLQHVGLYSGKVTAHGDDAAVADLKARGLRVSSIVCPAFTLDDPAVLAREQDYLNTMVDVAAEVGGIIYCPPGKGRFDEWTANVASYAAAVAPCIAHACARGVIVAFEPTLRPHLSFVHNLRDGLDLARDSGAAMVVDIGNCYTERDHRALIHQMAGTMAVVQISDVAVGTSSAPGKGLRCLPGEGELPLEDHIRAAHESGYAGPFEIEFMGEPDVDRAAIRRSLHLVDGMLRRVVGP